MNPNQVLTMTMHDLLVGMVIITLALAIPLAQIVRRAGFSPFWALLSLAPIFGVPALWIFSFIRWPRDAQQ